MRVSEIILAVLVFGGAVWLFYRANRHSPFAGAATLIWLAVVTLMLVSVIPAVADHDGTDHDESSVVYDLEDSTMSGEEDTAPSGSPQPDAVVTQPSVPVPVEDGPPPSSTGSSSDADVIAPTRIDAGDGGLQAAGEWRAPRWLLLTVSVYAAVVAVAGARARRRRRAAVSS